MSIKLVSAADLRDQILEDYKNEETLSPLRQAVKDAPDWKARLRAIRALYQAHHRLGADFSCFDPYSLELHDYWTPIEWRLWQDVRTTGGLRFVPQYPVGSFFLDFADPTQKIGIEADGKQFHNAERDRARDQRLWDEHGWRVFRVTGAETYRVRPSPGEYERDHYERRSFYPDFEDVEPHAVAFFSTTSEGVVRAIRDLLVRRDAESKWFNVMRAALDAHRLADFPIW